MQEDFQHKLDNITATIAGLQEGLAAQKENSIELAKSSSDINVIQPDSSEVPASGGWVVNVANSGHIETLEKLKKKLHKHGIQAETQEVIIGGKVRYRMRIPGFSTSDEARDYARNLDGDLGIKGPWVSKR
jgi:nucleotide-binding universal stress UspA family protein